MVWVNTEKIRGEKSIMQKVKDKLIVILISICYLVIVHLISVSEVISGLVVSIIIDIVFCGFLIDIKKEHEKSVLIWLCNKNNWFFNEHFFELNHSTFKNQIKLLVYSLVGIVPLSNFLFNKFYKGNVDEFTASIKLLKKADPLIEHMMYEIIITGVIVVVWAIFLSNEKRSKIYSSLYQERKQRTGNPYDSLDEKYRIFIGEYSDTEIKILNGGTIPSILNSQPNNNNP